MLTSRSAFQPGEYSATWKHTAQGPLTVRLNHISETDMNHSNCSVTINCVSQKGRHFSEKLFIVLLSARFLVIQSIRRALPQLRWRAAPEPEHTLLPWRLSPARNSSRIWCHFLPPLDTRDLCCNHQTLPCPTRLSQACEKGRSMQGLTWRWKDLREQGEKRTDMN